jgi:hypothetical protein
MSKECSEISSFQPKSKTMDTKNEILMVSDESIVYLSSGEEDGKKKTVANVESIIPSKRSQKKSNILLETTNLSKRKVTSGKNDTNEIKTDKLKKLKTNEPIKMSPFLEKLYKTTNQYSNKSIQPNQNTNKINLLENHEKKSSEKKNFNTSPSDSNCKESMKYQALNPIEIHQTPPVTCSKDENNNNFTQIEPHQIEILDNNSELELLFDENVFNEINLDCLDIIFEENLFQPQMLPKLSPIKIKESDNIQVCETTKNNQTKLLPKPDQIEEISQLELNDLKSKLKQMEAELNFYKKTCEKQEAENIKKDAELLKSKKQIMKDKTLIEQMKLNYGKLIFIN